MSDRPDFTDGPEPLAPGQVQLEGGDTFTRVAADKANTTGELMVRVGVVPHAELRIEPGSYTSLTSPLGDARGREDGTLGAKLELHEAPAHGPSAVPALAVLVFTSVPTGSSVFRQRAMQPEAKLASDWTLSDRVDFGANIDVARPVESGERFTEWAVSGSLGVSLTTRYSGYAELFGVAPQLAGERHTGYADTGVLASLTPNFQVDARVGIGFNGASPDYFVGAGFARRW